MRRECAPTAAFFCRFTETLNSSVCILSEKNSHTNTNPKPQTEADETTDSTLVSPRSGSEICSLVHLSHLSRCFSGSIRAEYHPFNCPDAPCGVCYCVCVHIRALLVTFLVPSPSISGVLGAGDQSILGAMQTDKLKAFIWLS